MSSLKYLGTKKGEIIKAISVDSLYKWAEIRDALGLTNDSLKPLIKEMKSEGILEEKGSDFRVDYDLWVGYRAYFGDEWAINKLKELEKEKYADPKYVAQVVYKALHKKKPKLRYRVKNNKQRKLLELFPSKWADFLIRNFI